MLMESLKTFPQLYQQYKNQKSSDTTRLSYRLSYEDYSKYLKPWILKRKSKPLNEKLYNESVFNQTQIVIIQKFLNNLRQFYIYIPMIDEFKKKY